MDKNLEQLIEVSRYFGSNEEFVIAGGGNTSYKDERKIWVKASGACLNEISLEEFAVLDRAKLHAISKTSLRRSGSPPSQAITPMPIFWNSFTILSRFSYV